MSVGDNVDNGMFGQHGWWTDDDPTFDTTADPPFGKINYSGTDSDISMTTVSRKAIRQK